MTQKYSVREWTKYEKDKNKASRVVVRCYRHKDWKIHNFTFGYVKLVVCLLNHNQFVSKSKCWLTSMVSCEWKGQECG